jgi:hypothetical protein
MEPVAKNPALVYSTVPLASSAYRKLAQLRLYAPLPNVMTKSRVQIMESATMASAKVAIPMAPMVVETLVTQIPHASTVRSAMLLASANGILEAHQISALSALRTMIVAPGYA